MAALYWSGLCEMVLLQRVMLAVVALCGLSCWMPVPNELIVIIWFLSSGPSVCGVVAPIQIGLVNAGILITMRSHRPRPCACPRSPLPLLASFHHFKDAPDVTRHSLMPFRLLALTTGSPQRSLAGLLAHVSIDGMMGSESVACWVVVDSVWQARSAAQGHAERVLALSFDRPRPFPRTRRRCDAGRDLLALPLCEGKH